MFKATDNEDERGDIMAEHINKTDTLNEGRVKLNNAITAFNETVVVGDSSVEAAQARVDEKGERHATLKARIDDGFEKTSSQLAKTDADLENVSERVDGIDRGYGGTYATLENLQTAFPNGDTKRYVVSGSGDWYYWNGIAWISGGKFQGTGIADGDVTARSLSNNASRGLNYENSALYHGATKMLNPVFELGGYSPQTGLPLETSIRIRTPEFVYPQSNLTVSLTNKELYKFIVITYDLDGNFVPGENFQTNKMYLRENYKYKFVLAKTDNSEVTDINALSANIIIAEGNINTIFKPIFKSIDFEKTALNFGAKKIIDNVFWEHGSYGSGGKPWDENYTRVRTADFIHPTDTFSVQSLSDSIPYQHTIFTYDLDGEYVTHGASLSDIGRDIEVDPTHKYKIVLGLESNDVITDIESFIENIVIVEGKFNNLVGHKQPRPLSGVVNFTVDVNVNLEFLGTENTVSVQDGKDTLEDNGLLFLPDNYDSNGKPLKLVINCHGAGTIITPTSDLSIYPGYMNYLVNGLGYAVLDMNAIPKSLSGNSGLHFGSPIALQAYLKGYEYAIENYNLEKDVFIIGTSMGGLTSNMLVQSGTIPVKAQGSFCGVVDYFKQAWCKPWSSGQREKIANLFNFSGAPPIFTTTGYPNQDEIDYYMSNIDKVIGYDPIMKNTFNWNNSYYDDYGDTLEETNYNSLIKYHQVPLKVWHNDNDTTVLPRYSEYFVKAIRNAGGLAYLRRFPSGGHNAWNNGDMVSTTDYKGNAITIESSAYELGLWFDRFA